MRQITNHLPTAELQALDAAHHMHPFTTNEALARKGARKSEHTIRIGKEAFYRQAEMSLADAYRFAAEVMTDNMMARDAREGICAFIEKRQPTWQDR